MSQSVSQILGNVENVNAASTDNSNGVLCIVEINEKTTRVSEDIRALSELSLTNSENLKSIISKFKL